jgi:drug/metabolite transporter (DMT)-like permease
VAGLALLVVTAVWGLTFLQVKEAVALYPLFGFLAVRFAIATAALAPVALPRLRRLGREGLGAGLLLGGVLAAAYALQTAGLQRTTVSSAGFITGLYVVLTPLCALALFRVRSGRAAWAGALVATIGLGMLSGIGAGSTAGDLLVLACAAVNALQIVLMERYAPRYDAVAITFLEMLACLVTLGAVALARGEIEVPHGWTVWSALLVTGLFASAFAFLVQAWAQRTISAVRIALVFALEPVFAGIFGYLHGDRLGWLGWSGCAVIMLGIAASEPSAAAGLRTLVSSGPRRALLGEHRVSEDPRSG